MTDASRITVGEIRGVYGVRGWGKLFSWTRPRKNLLEYAEFETGNGRRLRIVEGREQGKTLIARIDGVDDRDAAMALHGTTLFVPRDALPEPDAGQFYWSDLIGCTVSDAGRGVIGTVDHLLETGAHDVMVVTRAGQKDELIPFAMGQVVLEVDLIARAISVDWAGSDGVAG